MATRPSGSTPRSKKSGTRTLPPVTTVTNREEQQLSDADAVDNPAADGVVGEVASDGNGVEITEANLQQRDLPSISQDRQTRIAERAYWRAERRGFAAGQELEDWLDAEREVDEESNRQDT
ncbi:MAG: DUF2934 domain-containing protein [Steroidobacter sp.]